MYNFPGFNAQNRCGSSSPVLLNLFLLQKWWRRPRKGRDKKELDMGLLEVDDRCLGGVAVVQGWLVEISHQWELQSKPPKIN